MEIVIKISEQDYYDILQYVTLTSNTDFENLMIRAVQNGTPLPKGHGKLKDVSGLFTVTDIKSNGSEFTYVPYSEIDDAPTIIEADKESEK